MGREEPQLAPAHRRRRPGERALDPRRAAARGLGDHQRAAPVAQQRRGAGPVQRAPLRFLPARPAPRAADPGADPGLDAPRPAARFHLARPDARAAGADRAPARHAPPRAAGPRPEPGAPGHRDRPVAVAHARLLRLRALPAPLPGARHRRRGGGLPAPRVALPQVGPLLRPRLLRAPLRHPLARRPRPAGRPLSRAAPGPRRVDQPDPPQPAPLGPDPRDPHPRRQRDSHRLRAHQQGVPRRITRACGRRGGAALQRTCLARETLLPLAPLG